MHQRPGGTAQQKSRTGILQSTQVNMQYKMHRAQDQLRGNPCSTCFTLPKYKATHTLMHHTNNNTVRRSHTHTHAHTHTHNKTVPPTNTHTRTPASVMPSCTSRVPSCSKGSARAQWGAARLGRCSSRGGMSKALTMVRPSNRSGWLHTYSVCVCACEGAHNDAALKQVRVVAHLQCVCICACEGAHNGAASKQVRVVANLRVCVYMCV